MTVYKIDPLTDPRWADLQQRHAQASLFHTQAWLEALKRTYGYEPVAYTTSAPESDLKNGVVFCDIKTWPTGRRLVSLPFSDHCRPLVSSSEESTHILNSLRAQFAHEHWRHIEVRCAGIDMDPATGFEPGATYYLHTLDLRPTLDELYSRFHKDSVRRKIHRAERESLKYEQGNSESLLSKFYDLLLLTRRRHKIPPQPIQWFRNLIACLGEAVTIRVAFKDARPIASILTLRHKRTLIYKYGCSDQKFSNLGGTQLLFWKAIQDAKNSQLDELDMGRSDIDNAGLVTFKDRWGATRSALPYWRYPGLSEGFRRSWAARAVAEMLVHMPDRIVTSAGKLLYRYVG